MGGRAEIASVLAHDVRSPVATIKSLATTTTQSYDRLSDAERTEFVGLNRTGGFPAARHRQPGIPRPQGRCGDGGPGEYLGDLATLVREGLEAVDTAEHPLTEDLAPTHGARRSEVPGGGRPAAGRQRVKFSPRRVSDHGHIGAKRRRHALIEVDDRGPGIPAEQRDEVVQRFVAMAAEGLRRATRKGLGLFISRGLACRTQGEISVDDGTRRGYDAPRPAARGGADTWMIRPARSSLLICDDHKILTDAFATVVGLDASPRMVTPPVHDPGDGDRALPPSNSPTWS